MINKFSELIKDPKGEIKQSPARTKERQILEQKVKEGTDFAIQEYYDVFKKLAEYDKNNAF